MNTIKYYEWELLSSDEKSSLVSRPALSNMDALQSSVLEIIQQVKSQGDNALLSLTKNLDGVSIPDIKVSQEEIQTAELQLNDDDKKAIQKAAKNISLFHKAQIPEAIEVETTPGVYCERVIRPISSVGLYVPAGNAPLPSTALMLGIPAMLAGCPQTIMCSPPQADGTINAAVLYAANVCKISNIYKIGGAQAIAAMAYGTESVPKVTKLFGPGNAWVTEAKEAVSRDPDGATRDMPAGPSEIMVIADDTANPIFIAADLLSQAEHGPDSQAVLVSTCEDVLSSTLKQIKLQCEKLSRYKIIKESLKNSWALLVRDIDTAITVANMYAPEHLILQTQNPREVLNNIQAAGSVFLGRWAPESIGDYCSGTNHVLPTYGYARSYSSLSVTNFLRSMTVQTLTRKGFQKIGPIAERLATLEGLDAHYQAVRLRLESINTSNEGSNDER